MSEDPKSSVDFELRHFLYDTLILLGAKPEVAQLLKKSQDYIVSEDDIAMLRRYNIELIEAAKTRLSSINQTAVRVKKP